MGATDRLFGRHVPFTAPEVRSYLVVCNGWTDKEVDALLEETGTAARTEDEWYAAIDKFNREHPA